MDQSCTLTLVMVLRLTAPYLQCIHTFALEATWPVIQAVMELRSTDAIWVWLLPRLYKRVNVSAFVCLVLSNFSNYLLLTRVFQYSSVISTAEAYFVSFRSELSNSWQQPANSWRFVAQKRLIICYLSTLCWLHDNTLSLNVGDVRWPLHITACWCCNKECFSSSQTIAGTAFRANWWAAR